MGLAERIAAGAPVRQPRVDKIMNQELSARDRAALITAAQSPEWSDDALTRVLQDEGFVVGVATVAAWRANIKNDPIPTIEPLPVEPPVERVELVVEPPV